MTSLRWSRDHTRRLRRLLRHVFPRLLQGSWSCLDCLGWWALDLKMLNKIVEHASLVVQVTFKLKKISKFFVRPRLKL